MLVFKPYWLGYFVCFNLIVFAFYSEALHELVRDYLFRKHWSSCSATKYVMYFLFIGFINRPMYCLRKEKKSFKGAFSGLRQFLEIESPLKMMKNAFYFTLKALLALKIFKLLSWLLRSCRKTTWLERPGLFQNLWPHNLVNKPLQYTHWPISQEIRAIGQWNLVS